MTQIEALGFDVVGIRAANPGPFTLDGTNSWIVGRDPAWLIDPGPSLPEHVDALTAEIEARGGLGAILLTHRHADHSEAVPAIRERFPDAVLAAGQEEDRIVTFGEPRALVGEPTVVLSDGTGLGPLKAILTPGHAPDHVAFALAGGAGDSPGGEGGRAGGAGDSARSEDGSAAGEESDARGERGGARGELVFTGDAVLGAGSVLITPYPGAMATYLDALARLRRRPIAILAPGHGPLVEDAAAKLDEYIAHRLDRERRLIAALDSGRRSVDKLLEDVWSDAPAALRPAATATLAAHLDKLADEGRLPDGVERPAFRL